MERLGSPNPWPSPKIRSRPAVPLPECYSCSGRTARATTKGESSEREIVLSPACRFFAAEKEPTKIEGMQRINGPGVFLRLTDVIAVEVIDARQSACKKLPQ